MKVKREAGKPSIRTISLVIIIVALAGCVKYPPYESTEDNIQLRKDTTALALTNILSPDSIGVTIKWLQAMGTRFALADNHRTVALSIRNKFIKMGYFNSRLDSFPVTKTYKSQVYTTMQYNVIAEVRGSRYPDSVIIIGAHYDAIVSSGDPFISTSGANDNASGTAAMIEIARVMKKKDYRPLSSVQFVAFGAEELGLLGSYSYSSRIEQMGMPVKLMINNDMIANVASLNPLTWKVKIISYNNSADILEKSKSMCNRYTNISYVNDNEYYNRSDSYPFFLKGCKAVFFMANSTDTYYHTSDDRYINCNFEFCKEVAGLSCALIVWCDTHEKLQ